MYRVAAIARSARVSKSEKRAKRTDQADLAEGQAQYNQGVPPSPSIDPEVLQSASRCSFHIRHLTRNHDRLETGDNNLKSGLCNSRTSQQRFLAFLAPSEIPRGHVNQTH